MADKSKQKTIKEQPSTEDEKELSSIRENHTTTVLVRGQKWKAKSLHPGAIRKMTDVMLNSKDEDNVSCKCVAAFRLNGWWKIKLFYGLLWRWMFYFRQYREDELLPYIAECKKKIPVQEYAINIILLTEMRDTVQAMTREEVKRIQVAQLTEQLGQSAKSTPTSQPQDTSSGD